MQENGEFRYFVESSNWITWELRIAWENFKSYLSRIYKGRHFKKWIFGIWLVRQIVDFIAKSPFIAGITPPESIITSFPPFVTINFLSQSNFTALADPVRWISWYLTFRSVTDPSLVLMGPTSLTASENVLQKIALLTRLILDSSLCHTWSYRFVK